ncbi:hypothetical protein BU23DRAFT_67129 [Bimuria novae-zelandiae CBS 107.79]|uniref:Uncharacterized protein n=1 Tax=Bimuria novae-zelandiae CBS 107.79 TaxID=1447943 RepID=A0A6A5VE33_9PLEO|nr:hypothetical protein BU23DRAFT_67129 [Bimuria novae-zelandiae CBS 107.79]
MPLDSLTKLGVFQTFKTRFYQSAEVPAEVPAEGPAEDAAEDPAEKSAREREERKWQDRTASKERRDNITARNNSQSLLQRLPLELRLHIYDYLRGGPTFQAETFWSRLRLEKSNEFPWWSAVRKSRTIVYRCGDFRALMLTCRFLHREIDSLYFERSRAGEEPVRQDSNFNSIALQWLSDGRPSVWLQCPRKESMPHFADLELSDTPLNTSNLELLPEPPRNTQSLIDCGTKVNIVYLDEQAVLMKDELILALEAPGGPRTHWDEWDL